MEEDESGVEDHIKGFRITLGSTVKSGKVMPY